MSRLEAVTLVFALVASGCNEVPPVTAHVVAIEPAPEASPTVGSSAAPASLPSAQAAAPRPGATLSAQPASVPRTLRLHFPDGVDHGDCVVHRTVDRQLPAAEEPLNYAMRTLLAGPTASEQMSGLWSPFAAGSTGGTPAPPMAQSFRGVRLTPDGIAVVSFDAAAMAQLNSAICAQTTIKSAIEQTLDQFVEVQGVEYEVGGVIVSEWDA